MTLVLRTLRMDPKFWVTLPPDEFNQRYLGGKSEVATAFMHFFLILRDLVSCNVLLENHDIFCKQLIKQLGNMVSKDMLFGGSMVKDGVWMLDVRSESNNR